jgi:hypothetical protein
VTTRTRRALTPVTITERHPTHRAGRIQAWAAVSDDDARTQRRMARLPERTAAVRRANGTVESGAAKEESR